MSRFRYIDCKTRESRINLMKNFNETWISPGTMVIEKDSLKKHVNSAPHKQKGNLGFKENLCLGMLLTLKKSSRKH